MQGKKLTAALSSLGFCLGLGLVSCETQTSLTRSRTKSVERGLLRAVYLKGQKPEKLSLAKRMSFYRVPGVSIAVLDRYEIDWAKAYGVKDIRSGQPLTPETVFQAGELSQPVAAAIALHLVDGGEVGLDEDINGRLQSWKVPDNKFTTADKVTLRTLLTHSAGFTGRVFPGYGLEEPAPGLGQILRGEKPASNSALEPEFFPGSKVRDAEAGFAVLEQLLSDLSGRTFPELAKETVFDTLGMKDSTFELPLPQEGRAKASSGHRADGSPVDGGWDAYPLLAAKGLWTSPTEFSAFVLEVMRAAMGKSEAVLSPAAARSMLSVQLEYKGFGLNVDGTGQDGNINLRGRTEGYTSFLIVYPYRGQGAVIMTNSSNGGLLTEEILRAVSAAYGWPHFKPAERPLLRLDPSVYKQYVGRYEVSPDYILDVSSEDYYLVITPTGQAPTKFYVQSETLFFSIDPYTRVQFRRDESGKVSGLVLWQQDFESEARKID
jgi:CubicO group peptidase (beta-lactamase class C family)